MAGPENEGTPQHLREGVRAGILSSLEHDRGGRTARRLVLAGAFGVAGAVGITLLLAGHPYGHHPSWHAVVFGAIWTGLLVVAFSLALLEVRTSTLLFGSAAEIAMLGLALAGVCGAACPDQHFLHWWWESAPGRRLAEGAGLASSAACFGLVTTGIFGAGAALLRLRSRREATLGPLLPAATLFALLVPGVALQSVGTSWPVLSGWLLGTAAGAYLGVASGLGLRSRRR